MSKQTFNKTLLVFLFLMTSPFIFNEFYAQDYSFSEIKELFLRERPQTGDISVREECFGSIDDIIVGTYPPLHPDTEGFFKVMLEKSILEIKYEVVTDGATIWQIYNHGFVVKTPSLTFGFDLKNYFDTEEFFELANLIDVYFISHRHGDHISNGLFGAMIYLNKPIVGPAEFNQVTIGMNAGDSLVIADLMVIAHDGLHSVPVRQFEVITPDGLRFLHTGDNQDSRTLPDVANVDVLMLNAWVNDSGTKSHIETIPIAIKKIKPKVTLPGHILELGHLTSHHAPILYREISDVDDGSLASDYCVLAWGERYHFDNSTNDSLKPNIVENLSYEILSDTVFVFWDTPQQAADGDSASFYRVIVDDLDDFIFAEQNFSHLWDSLATYNFKAYSYDDCGNQNENCAEINVTISDSYLRIFPRETVTEIGKVCSVNVVLGNVSNLGSFQFDVIYDSQMMFADTAVMGDFLGSSGRTISIIAPDIDNTTLPGRLTFGGISSGRNPGANGSGVLATLIFTPQVSGSKVLELQNVQINDTNGQPINITLHISGLIEVLSSPSWITQTSGTNNNLNCVDAVSDLVAWAAGDNSTILRTTNGGEVWDYVWDGPDTLRFWSISGIDANHALVTGTGGKWSEGTNVTYIFRTYDGGISWTKVFERTLGFLDDVTMFNQSNGFAIGGEIDGKFLILKTTNRGKNWEYSQTAPIALDGEYPLNTAITWLDNSTCWFATSHSRAFYTTDAGDTWDVVEIPSLQNVVTIAFKQAGEGLAASENSMAKTIDNGESWQMIFPSPVGEIHHIVNHQDIFWALIDKSIYKSINNGLNWEKQISGEENLRFVSFITNQNGNFGWSVGENGSIQKYEHEITHINIDKKAEIPNQFSLQQNYPNPFNPITTIQYSLTNGTNVTLNIFNTLGQTVKSINSGFQQAGSYQFVWDGTNNEGDQINSGVYLYQIITDDFTVVKKMAFLK